MKIVIMGAGAMGGLFGGLLTLSEEEVWLVDIRKAKGASVTAARTTRAGDNRMTKNRVRPLTALVLW